MSHPPETTDLEAQIEALIKRAEDTLRQQLNDLHRCHAAEGRQDQAPQRLPSDPASGNPHDTGSTSGRRRMKSPMVKHSISIAGHKTSVSLEDAFWNVLKEIAARRHMTLSELAYTISAGRGKNNLSSAIRLFVLDFYQDKHGGNRAA